MLFSFMCSIKLFSYEYMRLLKIVVRSMHEYQH